MPPSAGLLQRVLDVIPLAAVRGELPHVLAQAHPVLPEVQDPEVVATQLWLALLFGTLCGTSAMAIPEEANSNAVTIVALADALAPFLLVMFLLVAPGSWFHSLYAAWQARIIRAVTRGPALCVSRSGMCCTPGVARWGRQTWR
jgi:hypothetical protein